MAAEMFTYTYYLIWLVFITIAVFDAREHRIPNYALLLVLVTAIIHKAFSASPAPSLIEAFIGALFMFGFSFVFFMLRAMAPGDVKLLGVVGFVVGWHHLLDTAFWIAVSTVIVGSFYAVYRLAERPELAQTTMFKYSVIVSGKGRDLISNDVGANKLRMPFAPIVVIGLALHQYF
ncbi:prepilin peptidase [Vibrio marisflavi]|uniref:Prepilin type IV endopeptidase peptidase domain-containing protein n=1 Tax=Vibrio marisflavi CECT 7928 TaxID=634439 RepID=A0ABM9A8P7_9VIBR|nr:A24 family peptidase [Vibrio marisflavi]CAH0541208.1 hypothetical protein VMF7928_03449 [Vibrio marisflavi CECT 7928]